VQTPSFPPARRVARRSLSASIWIHPSVRIAAGSLSRPLLPETPHPHRNVVARGHARVSNRVTGHIATSPAGQMHGALPGASSVVPTLRGSAWWCWIEVQDRGRRGARSAGSRRGPTAAWEGYKKWSTTHAPDYAGGRRTGSGTNGASTTMCEPCIISWRYTLLPVTRAAATKSFTAENGARPPTAPGQM
jgi:hypothetical protein